MHAEVTTVPSNAFFWRIRDGRRGKMVVDFGVFKQSTNLPFYVYRQGHCITPRWTCGRMRTKDHVIVSIVDRLGV